MERTLLVSMGISIHVLITMNVGFILGHQKSTCNRRDQSRSGSVGQTLQESTNSTSATESSPLCSNNENRRSRSKGLSAILGGNWTRCNSGHFTLQSASTNLSRNKCFLSGEGCPHHWNFLKRSDLSQYQALSVMAVIESTSSQLFARSWALPPHVG